MHIPGTEEHEHALYRHMGAQACTCQACRCTVRGCMLTWAFVVVLLHYPGVQEHWHALARHVGTGVRAILPLHTYPALHTHPSLLLHFCMPPPSVLPPCPSPPCSLRSGMTTPKSGLLSGGSAGGGHSWVVDHMVAEAWDLLRKALVLFRGKPVGTIAAMDSTESALNYDQVRGAARTVRGRWEAGGGGGRGLAHGLTATSPASGPRGVA